MQTRRVLKKTAIPAQLILQDGENYDNSLESNGSSDDGGSDGEISDSADKEINVAYMDVENTQNPEMFRHSKEIHIKEEKIQQYPKAFKVYSKSNQYVSYPRSNKDSRCYDNDPKYKKLLTNYNNLKSDYEKLKKKYDIQYKALLELDKILHGRESK